MGQRMMKQTATVQVNLDFESEADAMQKMRVATGIGPILNALFANSPISDGKPNGYLSYRGHIWTDTDNRPLGHPAVRVRAARRLRGLRRVGARRPDVLRQAPRHVPRPDRRPVPAASGRKA